MYLVCPIALGATIISAGKRIGEPDRTSHWQTALFLGHTALPTPDVFGHSSLISAVGGGVMPVSNHYNGN